MTVVASTILWRNIPNPLRMRSDIIVTEGQMNPLGRRRLLYGRYAGPPFGRRPDRPLHKTAAAVRAYIVELVLGAVRTEGALEAADSRFRCARRKVLVAVFAVRSQLQCHDRLVSLWRGGSSQIRCSIRMPNNPRFRTCHSRHSGMRLRSAIADLRRRPGIHNRDREYGFRARAIGPRLARTRWHAPE
jgi:hypothetical protein